MDLILLILAILPTVVLGYIIYTNDKIEKEPVPLLVKLALGGIGSVIVTLIITLTLEIIAPFFSLENITFLSPIELAIYVFIGIAIIEEFSKWIFIYLIAWKAKAFNHVYDAIVYSVFVSLGFATIENILYVFMNESFEESILVAINRMFFSVPGHAFFGVIMGYFIGLAKLTYVHGKREKTNKYLLLSLFVPTTCHFIFDYILMLGAPMFVFYSFVAIMFGYGISRMRRLANVPTNIFGLPANNNYVYNAFGTKNLNNQNNQNNLNNLNNQSDKICKNCGAKLEGDYCNYCKTKNY